MSQSESAMSKTRGERLREGAIGIGRSIWFVISLVLYALGTALLFTGRGLVRVSGWGSGAGAGRTGSDHTAASRPPPASRFQ